MNSGTITNQLLDAVQVLVDDAVKKAGYDRTVQAVIAKCVSATKGQYSVKYQGGYFYAYSQDPTATYTPETQVYVLIPGNDMNRTKTILGTVDKLGEDFIKNTESSVFGDVGNNICSDSEDTLYELHSYYVTDNIILYNLNYPITTDIQFANNKNYYKCVNYEYILLQPGVDYTVGSSIPTEYQVYEKSEYKKNSFNIDADAANLYLKNSDYLIIAAKFRTNLPMEHRAYGNYGLKYTLTFIDSLTGEPVDRPYVLDINNMVGQPYAQAVAIRQVVMPPYEIQSENFLRIKKIELFSQGFTTVTDLSKPADIFVSDVELNGALLLPVDEATGLVLSLVTKQGIYFKESDALSATRRIEAELYKDGEKQDITTEDVNYYWFKEDGTVYGGGPGYMRYGDAGWRCINETNEEGKFLPGKNYIEVSKLNNPGKENKYKCVVVFKNTNLYIPKEVTIYNQSSNYTVDLQSDVTELSDVATAHLTCEVSGVAAGKVLSYSWGKVVDNHLPTEFMETTSINTLTVDLKEAIRTITYKCTVTNITDNIVIGSSKITINRGASEVANYYYISMVNDNQVFKYDTHGDSPTNMALLNPQTIRPLSFILYSPDNEVIPFSDIGSENVTWIYPTENSMMTFSESPYLDNKQSIYFDIKNKYDINAINNTIEIEVNYDDKTIRGKANFIFLKEGENGSNGTSYYLNVLPNSVEGTEPDGRIFYYYKSANNQGFNFTPVTNEFPFKAIFYQDGEVIYNSTTDAADTNFELSYDFIKRIYGYLYSLTTDITFQNGKQYYKYNSRNKEYILMIKTTSTVDGDYEIGDTISNIGYAVYNKSSNIYQDESRFSISGNSITCTDSTFGDEAGEYSADILRCSLKYQNKIWYYYYPIIFVKYNENASDCEIEIPEDFGFTEVIYTEGGHDPQYKGNNIFDINVYREGDLIPSEIEWTVEGQLFDSEWQEEANLIPKSQDPLENEFIAIADYNGNCVTNALYGDVTDGTNDIAEIHFPIAMYINSYANEFINAWDGNAIELNEEGGIILTPQLAAGKKENDNTFTGVVAGVAKESSSSDRTAEEGIFGYHEGVRTFELSAEDGSAKFGKAGAGQIIISPDENSNHSVIESGNYVAPVLSPDGTIVLTEGEGLQIDLTEPSITFGSGKFRVEKDGTVHAPEYATVRSLSEGTAVISPHAVTGLPDVMDAVTIFQVDLESDSITIPCESNKQTPNNQTYVINANLTYAGQFLESYNTNNLTITTSVPTTDIQYTKAFNNGTLTITFTTKGTILNNLTNEYNCSFYYPASGETVNKKIILTLAPKGEAGTNGKSIVVNTTTYSYQNSSSGETPPSGGTWENSPDPQPGMYTWTKIVVTYKFEGTSIPAGSSTSYNVSYTGVDGQQGPQGISILSVLTLNYLTINLDPPSAPNVGHENESTYPNPDTDVWTRFMPSYHTCNFLKLEVYPSLGSFPVEGEEDVVYQIEGTNNYYIWAASESGGVTTWSYETINTFYYYVIVNNATKYYYKSSSSADAVEVYGRYRYFICNEIKYSNNTYSWTLVTENSELNEAIKRTEDLANIVDSEELAQRVAKIEEDYPDIIKFVFTDQPNWNEGTQETIENNYNKSPQDFYQLYKELIYTYKPVEPQTIYFKTNDTTFQNNKTYYSYDSENDTYTVYTGGTTGNPHNLDLYESKSAIVYDNNKIYYKQNGNIYQKISNIDIEEYFQTERDGDEERFLIDGIVLYEKNILNPPSQLTYEKYIFTADTSFQNDKIYYTYDNNKKKYVVYGGARTGNPHTLGLYEENQENVEETNGWYRTKNNWEDNKAIYSCSAKIYGDGTRIYTTPVLLTDYQTIEDKRTQAGDEILFNMRGRDHIFYDRNSMIAYDYDTERESLRRIVINSRGINFATRTAFFPTSDTTWQNKDYYQKDDKVDNVYYLYTDTTSNLSPVALNLYEETLKRYDTEQEMRESQGTNNSYYYVKENSTYYVYKNGDFKKAEKADVLNDLPAWETSSVWGIEGTMNLKRMDVNYLRADEISDGILTLGTTAADGKLVIQNDAGANNFQLSTQRFECPLYDSEGAIVGYIYIGKDIGLQCVAEDGSIRFGNELSWTAHSGGGSYKNNINYYTSQDINTLINEADARGEIPSGVTVYTCSCNGIFNLIKEKVYNDITFMDGTSSIIKTQTLVFSETIGSTTLNHSGIGFIIG